LKGSFYIGHLASYSSVAFSWKEPILSFQNNMNIFLNLPEGIRKLSLPARILSIGSSEEYGNVDEDTLPLMEMYVPRPISPYAVAGLPKR
jgi:GDP-4-dehydro-6-deoxy-D-mannose reductase